jgi:hypothetical protein
VTLGGNEAPTRLSMLERNPLELAEQVAKALSLTQLFKQEQKGIGTASIIEK